MPRFRALALAAIALALSTTVFAQELSHYRSYALENSLGAVITTSGARADDVRILQERPARIQELQIRSRYQYEEAGAADPMQGILFTFMDDRLYQLVVTYDRARTEGLTDADIIGSLVTAYGAPTRVAAPGRAGTPSGLQPDAIAVARWEDDLSSVLLIRAALSRDFQLVVTSKALDQRARTAIKEAHRLDDLEAPRREAERRKQDLVDAAASRDKTRTTNKGAFRP